MSHEQSLESVMEKAHQAEIISKMLEVYPNKITDSEITAIASLLTNLTGDVAAWLIEELSLREGK
ncbi:TPA: hypothetical protein MBD98_003355 [Klebsiella aerogenes]|uniref:hypothetical protein n=1 Tax=Enterobacteriaceae TaxID=543 RepID=UPI0009D32CE8|nr:MULTISPECIES: hypothetical protein [Enterobacteriaceae]HCH8949285.1 hypothetical protein [Shigella flexneri]EAB6803381.1 hypothetical protein [Escherichia coli]EEX0335958.1 hypothetical protein [Escherichia coli]EEX0382693.1 hypothetical protein [Escherichia coli]EFF0540542.1 hypothetical protein [Escherichia coli]